MGLIRLLLALSVVISHTSPVFGQTLIGGQLAVQSFYMVSGFYMALILNEKYIKNAGSYKLFISNRFLRLFPIYWAVAIIVILFSIAAGRYTNGQNHAYLQAYYDHGQSLSLTTWIFFIASNLIIFFQDWFLFLGLGNNGNLFFTSNFATTNPKVFTFQIIPPAWTIGLELMFYLVAPFIARKSVKIVGLVLLCSLGLRGLLYYGLKLDHSPWIYCFFPTELFWFLIGILGYRIYVRYKSHDNRVLVRNVGAVLFLLVIAATFAYQYFPSTKAGILYLVLIATAIPFVFIYTKSKKADRYIGELSYPIYISHLVCSTSTEIFPIPTPFGKGLTVCIMTVLISILLNELIIKPIERYRQRRVSRIPLNLTRG